VSKHRSSWGQKVITPNFFLRTLQTTLFSNVVPTKNASKLSITSKKKKKIKSNQMKKPKAPFKKLSKTIFIDILE
jgi:hypothetical protein